MNIPRRTLAICVALAFLGVGLAVVIGSRAAVTHAVPAATAPAEAPSAPDIDGKLIDSMAEQGTHVAITVTAEQRNPEEASAAEKAESVARQSLHVTESGTLRGVSFGKVTVDDYGVDTYPDATEPKLRGQITKLIDERELWAVAFDYVPMPVFGPFAGAKERKTVQSSTVVVLVDPRTMTFLRAETF